MAFCNAISIELPSHFDNCRTPVDIAGLYCSLIKRPWPPPAFGWGDRWPFGSVIVCWRLWYHRPARSMSRTGYRPMWVSFHWPDREALVKRDVKRHNCSVKIPMSWRQKNCLRCATCALCHHDISWWRHQIETFSALLAICEGNPPVTGNRWIPLTKASDAELWCFLRSALEQTVDQTIETPMIWNAIALIMTPLYCTAHTLSSSS